MNSLARILLCLIVGLTMAAACLAQQNKRRKPVKRKTTPAPMREEVTIVGPVTIMPPDPTEERQVGQATISYNLKLDVTSVIADLPEVYRRGRVSVNFQCSFGFDGREPIKPDKVFWAFVSDWTVFNKGDRLTVTADGKQYRYVPEPSDGLRGQRVVVLDFASFEQIAKSKNARVNFGQVVFDLKDYHREAFRDMLKVFGGEIR